MVFPTIGELCEVGAKYEARRYFQRELHSYHFPFILHIDNQIPFFFQGHSKFLHR